MNNIWHSKDELPEIGKGILIKFPGDPLYTLKYFGSDCLRLEVDYPIIKHTEKWCYLDDLISQSDRTEKLEQENAQLKGILKQALPAVRMFKGGDWIELKKEIESILKGDNNEADKTKN